MSAIRALEILRLVSEYGDLRDDARKYASTSTLSYAQDKKAKIKTALVELTAEYERLVLQAFERGTGAVEEQLVYIVEDNARSDPQHPLFEGSLRQFKECFFTNASIMEIQEWCKEQNYRLTMRPQNLDGS